MKLKNLDKRTSKIAILWYWEEGKASLKFLQKLWYKNITILDANSDLIIPVGISKKLWESYLEDLGIYDLIFKTPWISPYHEKIHPHRKKLYSWTELFFELYRWKVIGVTWTKWKSTISKLVFLCLKNAWFNVKIVWNIGKSVLNEIDLLWNQTFDFIVYELSSYMLEWFKPKLHIWYINNIYPCHLDWHRNLESYKSAKYNILEDSKYKIFHHSIKYWENSFWGSDSFHVVDEDIYHKDNVFIWKIPTKLYWKHNLENICWVAKILSCVLGDLKQIKKILTSSVENFYPLPHRLEKIGIFKWIEFIDDWAAVTPEATIAAIESTNPIVETLLIWGKENQSTLTQLEGKIIESNIKNIVLFPESWFRLFERYTHTISEEEVREIFISWKKFIIIKTSSMDNAVSFSYQYTKKWKTVLLSSAAQSYSLWKNFEEKWAQYKKYINKYASI